MQCVTGFENRAQEVADLFGRSFAVAGGPDEGAVIADLVRNLVARTDRSDLRAFRAEDAGQVIAVVAFTRLAYPDDARPVMLLSPMAVAPERQRQGIGQALITHALQALRRDGVEVAMTYGDPAYYHRVGFEPVTEDKAQAPLPLSQPHGWLGQSLTGGAMPRLAGRPRCVPALDRADLW